MTRIGADHVERADGVLDAALLQQSGREQDRGEADRRVDEEDPLPADVLGEHAAEQDADRASGARHRAPDRQGLVALVALGERRREDGERCGRDHRPAESLDGAGADEEVVRAREAAGQRGQGEEPEARHEQPATAEQVGTAPAEQQEPAERERVRARDPLQTRIREVQILLDRRQGDVHDRDVDDQHELGRAQEDQSDPAARIRGFGRHDEFPPGVVARQYCRRAAPGTGG